MTKVKIICAHKHTPTQRSEGMRLPRHCVTVFSGTNDARKVLGARDSEREREAETERSFGAPVCRKMSVWCACVQCNFEA